MCTKDQNDRLATLAKEQGLTTSELGEKVGVGSNYISIMENGKKPVSELQAMKLKELIEQRYKGKLPITPKS